MFTLKENITKDDILELKKYLDNKFRIYKDGLESLASLPDTDKSDEECEKEWELQELSRQAIKLITQIYSLSENYDPVSLLIEKESADKIKKMYKQLHKVLDEIAKEITEAMRIRRSKTIFK